MERVIVESPFAGKGDTEEERDRETYRNVQYLRACMNDCFQHDQAPYASHGLYTQPGVLDDKVPEERDRGIKAGFLWGEAATRRKFYVDLGMSRGMEFGMGEGKRLGQKIDEVRLGPGWEELDTGVVVPPSLAAELRCTLKGYKNRFTNRVGFSDEFVSGYQQGLAEARDVVSGKKLE